MEGGADLEPDLTTPSASTVGRLADGLLGGPPTLSLAALAERTGASVGEVRLFWHALGLPTGAPDELAFTEADARLLVDLLGVRDAEGLHRRTSVSLIRAIGHSTDRLVQWQVEALVEHVGRRLDLDDTSARVVVLDRLAELAPLLERQLVHAWRHQLVATAERYAASVGAAHEGAPREQLPLERAVGFADVAGFTQRTAHLGSHELADFVQGFESRARDVVTAGGGRVVKTVGDAVLFVTDDPRSGARIALGLAEALGASSPTPVRVGLVWGRVLARFGDVFGPAVNLAARLSDEAELGGVLVDRATAAALDGWSEVRLEPQAERDVPGVGALQPVALRPAGGG